MQPNWNYVKMTTLWHYEDLIKKLQAVMAYPIIWRAYNHNMAQAADFAGCLFPDKNIESGEFPAGIIHSIKRLQDEGIQDWGDLLSRIATREDCLAFVMGSALKFEDFIDVLNYLLRWGFPFQTSSRELLEHENPQEMADYGVLKRH